MTSRETVERIAETIYGAMRFDRSPAAPEWVPGGNSDAQVIARQAATNIAAAILHGIAVRAEAVAWIRFCSDGTFEGPIHNSKMGDIRRRSGAWAPLYTHPPASVPEYDRAMIAEVLIGCAAGKRGKYTTDCMLEQARLLREAENTSAAKVRTVSRASAPEVTHPDDLAVDLFATAMKAMLAAAPQPEAAQPAGEAEEVGVFGERFIDGMGWAVPCSRAAPYVAAMRKAAFAMAEKEAGAYVGAGAHGIPDEPAPSAPADVEADIQKLESYLDDAGYPKDGDAQLTLESLAARLASAPQPTQRGGEGVEAVKQSLTGGGKNE